MPDKKLVMIGAGPMLEEIKATATPNIQVLGYQPFAVMRDHMQRAKAFVFAAEEDFGITPLEAQACGTPVLGFGRGGTRETVRDGETGLFFNQQTVESIIDAVQRFESRTVPFDPLIVRAQAERFSIDHFRKSFTSFVLDNYHSFREYRGF
jgi:glycosyltransferase involved in cell wall biosynthesis